MAMIQAKVLSQRRKFENTMKKKIFLFIFLIFFYTNIFGQPPGKEQNPDWPCIQVLIKELSWGSIWTGQPLDDDSSKWVDDDSLRSLAEKLMNRKTKEEEGIKELKKYIKKNNSAKERVKLFHALFDTTNEIWKKRINKLLNFGKRQRLTAEKISIKLEKIKELSEDLDKNKEEIQKLEQERLWDVRRFEDRRSLSDSLCEQPRFYEKRLGVYSSVILDNIK